MADAVNAKLPANQLAKLPAPSPIKNAKTEIQKDKTKQQALNACSFSNY